MHIEKIAVVCFLVACREAAEYDHVVIWYLEETTAFQAYPVRVFFYFQIESFPMISLFQVKDCHINFFP